MSYKTALSLANRSEGIQPGKCVTERHVYTLLRWMSCTVVEEVFGRERAGWKIDDNRKRGWHLYACAWRIGRWCCTAEWSCEQPPPHTHNTHHTRARANTYKCAHLSSVSSKTISVNIPRVSLELWNQHKVHTGVLLPIIQFSVGCLPSRSVLSSRPTCFFMFQQSIHVEKLICAIKSP